MAFEINMYKTQSENNRVDKVLYDGIQISGTLRNESEIVHPVIRIEGNEFIGYNYCQIPIWNRYYFIRDITSVRNNIFDLHLEVDTLMSFKDSLRKEAAIIDKQAKIKDANMYIDDGDWIVQNNEFIQILNWDNGFNNEGEFILIAAGGELTI